MLIAATHSGVFHADDVFAAACLTVLLEGEVHFVRTRDEAEIAQADIVFDVGGVYDPAARRFDHHQAGFNETEHVPGHGEVPLSSVGLIWRQYGSQICVDPESGWEDPEAADLVYRRLIAGIDAADNGVRAEGAPVSSVSSAVSAFVPSWDEDTDVDAAFEMAVAFAEGVLRRAVRSALAECRAETLFFHAVNERTNRHVVVLDRYLPWTGLEVDEEVLYVVFPGSSGGYMVQQVPTKPGGVTGRKPLPEAWAGLRGAELAAVCGVVDATFVHNGRFIGGAKTLVGALAMARKAALVLEEVAA